MAEKSKAIQDTTTAKHAAIKRTPAWIDDDDDNIRVDLAKDGKLRKLRDSYTDTNVLGSRYSQKLRSKFEDLLSAPSWASGERPALSDSESSNSDPEEDEEDVYSLNIAGKVLKKSEVLPKDSLDVKQLRSCSLGKSSRGVSSVHFHPKASVLLATGNQRNVVVFQIDGESNPILQSIEFADFPISQALFTPTGQEVMGLGSRKGMFVYDISSGKITRLPSRDCKGQVTKFALSPDNAHAAFLAQNGYISIFSNKNKQWLFDLKMSGTVEDAVFSSSSQELYSFGSDGEVYIWDLNMRRCKHKFVDEGCVNGTCIAASPLDNFFACGSDSGVVNLYDQSCTRMAAPRPLRDCPNLTTPISQLCFNPNQEILAMSSADKKSSLRLLHMQSNTVFSGWPPRKNSLDKVTAINFSPSSQYLACGNAKGKVVVYRLNHYN